MSRILLHLTLLGLSFSLAACSKKTGHEAHADHAQHGHVHVAPHGGTLVELGDHQYNLELVLDPTAGKLAAYVLGGHAENFIRVSQPSLELSIVTVTGPRSLTLNAVGNAATGETPGDTSQFEASAEWLKAAGPLTGTVARIEVRGSAFTSIAFSVAPVNAAAGAAKTHAH
jgi:hypothetical protein